jgi:hypothetical protein
MDPNQPKSPLQPQASSPQPSLPADYLNQIAPKTIKRKLPFTKMQRIILAVVGVAIIVVLVLVIVTAAGGGKKPIEQLAARLLSTETIAKAADVNIKSSQLRALNSNLVIYLTNTNRDIAAPLLEIKLDVTKLDKTVVASEAGTDVTARLNDARLNAVYDSTYAREIAYRLGTTIALMQQIDGSTSNKDLKSFLGSAITNLQPTQKSFGDFNDTND